MKQTIHSRTYKLRDYFHGYGVGPIIRNGKVGEWRTWFVDGVDEKANKWIEEHYKNTDLRFPINFEYISFILLIAGRQTADEMTYFNLHILCRRISHYTGLIVGLVAERLKTTGEFMDSVRVFTEKTTFKAFKYYPDHAETIYNFTVRPDDVWVLTYPKSGTTLTQEMVWLIANGEKGYEIAEKVPLVLRFPFLELTCLTGENFKNAEEDVTDDKKWNRILDLRRPQWEVLEETPNRRFIKSHLPFPLLPPSLLTSGCKILYIARNPKDVGVSTFKFLNQKDFPATWELFQNGHMNNGPYWEHVKLGWNARSNKNVCFMFYEDMLKDMKSTIRKVAQFLERHLTDEQLLTICEKNESVVNFFGEYLNDRCRVGPLVREGKSGGWRNWFDDELNEKANKWIEDNYKETDLRFPTDLLK
ncbi:hypothetical protein NQ317_003428 [Molorchus minor]|uniref:Sulfotransferase domain-containing protein n=1 Tax=Molorchus minor TaxID=1323400 RepID=A0ABQ9JHX6_9CUCU|nr:hypothetical protein NQ317_003428 [Molorchus minor]